MRSVAVSDLRFSPASRDDAALGLLGFVSFLIDGRLGVDGVAVRRRLGGGLTLSWPARTDANGHRHPYLRPVGEAARREIEAQVLEALSLAGRLP